MTEDLQKARRKWFKTLDPVLLEEMVGLWRGEGIAADHPLDGVPENLNWFGKRFQSDLKATPCSSSGGLAATCRSSPSPS